MRRGLVITMGKPEAGMVFQMVLNIDHNYTRVRDFVLVPVQTQRVKIVEKPIHDIKDKRSFTIQKNIDDTLIYGEIIEWQERNEEGEYVDIVTEYFRSPKLYQARISNGETQLLLKGIMSKNRKVLWMLNMWPDLDIPYHLQQLSHPNVVVNAWVTLQILPNQTLKYTLSSFESVADSFQHLCHEATWNEGDVGNLPEYWDPVQENSNKVNPFVTPLACSLTGMNGIVISNKMIISYEPKHRDLCFHRVVIQEKDKFPPVGSHVTFNAEKLNYLNIYAVSDVFEMRKETKSLPVTEDKELKVTIRANEQLPGFYFSELLGVFFDDPQNLLESWLLSRYSKSTLQVAVTAGEPSDKGTPRYAIIKITDAKLKKVEKLIEDGEIKLENEKALVIDERGKLHFPRLPKSVMRIPKDLVSKFPPGTPVRVSAKLESRWKVLSVEEDTKAHYFEAASEFDPITEQNTIWFKIPEARGNRELPYLLKADVFGLLETPRNVRLLKEPEQRVVRNVWVSVNHCHSGDVLLPPAKFRLLDKGELNVEPNLSSYPSSLNTNEFEDSFEIDENRPEYASNTVGVPTVYRPITDEEALHQLEMEGVNIDQITERFRNNAQFQANPVRVLNQEIRDHTRTCTKCTPTQISERCFFLEFLSEVILMKPEAIGAIEGARLSDITLRRFR